MRRCSFIGIGLAVALLPTQTLALAPDVRELNGANIVVDGNPSDWDLSQDLLSDLYKFGNVSDGSRSKAYARYDCLTGTMYILVLNSPGWFNRPNDDNNYVKKLAGGAFGVRGNSGNNGTPPDFQAVPSADGTALVGWEASLQMAAGDYPQFVIYNYLVSAAVRGNDPSDTFSGSKTHIVIDCSQAPTPTPVPTATPTASPTPTPTPTPPDSNADSNPDSNANTYSDSNSYPLQRQPRRHTYSSPTRNRLPNRSRPLPHRSRRLRATSGRSWWSR